MNDQPRVSRRDFVGWLTGCCAGLSTLTLGERPGAAAESDQAGRAGWQIGAYTRPWDKFDYRVALDAMVEAGYQYAGLMTSNVPGWVLITPSTTLETAQQMGEEARKRGLRLASVYGNYGGGSTVAEGVAELRRLIELCAGSGSPRLLLGGTDDPKRYEAYYQAVAECCPYAWEKGVSLSIKPHGGLNATGPQCRKAIERVGHKNFGLWYDPGNIFYYSNGQLDPVEDVATVNGLVVGVSVKDYRHPKEVLVTPGSGKVDFAKVFARLIQGGFRGGPVLVECLEPGDLAQITAAARKTRLFLEGLLGQKAAE